MNKIIPDSKSIKDVATSSTKKKLTALESELLSLDTRIKDLEWQYVYTPDDIEDLDSHLDQRRKAIDKKKHVIKDISALREQLIEE